MRFLAFSISVFIYLVIGLGCSNNSGTVVPFYTGHDNLSGSLPDKDIPVIVSDYRSDGSPGEGMGIVGLFSLCLDPVNANAVLTPLRNVYSADVFEIVDITNFLHLAPCTDCAKIKSIALDADENLVLRIGIKHPFETGDPLKPITGLNRADLHVFNVEGTLISDGDGAIQFPSLQQSIGGFNLLSADGYSPYLDIMLDGIYPTDATMHPYVLHFDDYSTGNFAPTNPMGFESVTEPPPSGNLVMAMGCGYDFKDYVFDLDSPTPGDFIYAIGCTFGVSITTMSRRFSPEYRIPQHNKKAASEVRTNILSNDLKSRQATSSASLQIEVLDINHGISVGDNIDQMLADSSVGMIEIEIPGVLASPVVIPSPIPAGGNGRDPADPLKYQINIQNTALGSEGMYHGLVKILDTYAPGQNPLPIIDGKDGIKRVKPTQNPVTGLFEINEFATYSTFEINVGPGFVTNPPVAVISSPCPDNVIHVDSSIFLDGRLSTDDGSITGYAWDFDWDLTPQNFDIESTLDNLNHLFTTSGGFVVGLRVEDDEGQFGFESVNIMVVPQSTPSWIPGLPIGQMTGADGTEREFQPSRMIAVDCDNVVHCIIKNSTSGTLYYVNYDGSVVSPPETLSNFGMGFVQAVLAIDPRNDDLHLTYYTFNTIKYRKRTGGAWTSEEDIVVPADVPGYGIGNASMDVNYLGEIMVVFDKENSGYVWFNDYVMNDGSGWTDPVDICGLYVRIDATKYTRPNTIVRADNEGRFHLIFKSWPSSMAIFQYYLFYSIYDDGAWGPIVNFNQDFGFNISVSGFAAPDGDVFCVWQASRFGTFNGMYQRWDASTETWGTPIRVTQNPLFNDYSFIPDIAVDADGHVVYVWEYYDGFMRHVYYKTFGELDDASTIFNAPETDVESSTGNMMNPNLFLGVDGRVHLIWDDDRSQPGNFTARDVYYSVFD